MKGIDFRIGIGVAWNREDPTATRDDIVDIARSMARGSGDRNLNDHRTAYLKRPWSQARTARQPAQDRDDRTRIPAVDEIVAGFVIGKDASWNRSITRPFARNAPSVSAVRAVSHRSRNPSGRMGLSLLSWPRRKPLRHTRI